MIYFVTGRPDAYDWDELNEKDIEFGSFDEFVFWVENESDFGVDTETTMVKDGPDAHEDRELTVFQIGNEEDQWVIDFMDLPQFWIKKLSQLLSDTSKKFYLHNAKFDYIVLFKALGVKTESMHCTFLMSKILNTGIETYGGYHSLKGCLKRFFDIEMSKEEQTTFDGEPLSIEQIYYAAVDVVMLESLFLVLKEELEKWNLWFLYNDVERNVMKAYADMELSPMRFDKEYWLKLADEFDIEDARIEKELNESVFDDPELVEYLKQSENVLKEPLIQPRDQLYIKWGSTIHKNKILSLLAPSLPGDATTKQKIKKFIKEKEATLPERELDVLKAYMNREYSDLENLLVENYYDWLIKNELLIEENTIRIKWSSPIQKLYIFQFYYPRLMDTNKSSLNKIKKNDLINKYKEYSSVHKTVTTYGRKFLDNYVKRDGTIAPTKLSQILSTGRVALIYRGSVQRCA